MQVPINKSKKQKTLIDIKTIDLVKAINPSITIQQRKQIFKYIYQLKIRQHIELRQLLDITLQQKQFEQLIEEFNSLMGFFKEYQAITPIVDLFYGGYKKAILQKNYNLQVIWNNWKHVPLSNLQDYIQTFKLQEFIDKTDRNQFYEIIRELLLKCKNKEAALFCTLFRIGDESFLIDEVMPRLLQGQDIYTTYVTNLFQTYPVLLDAIVEHLDPVAAIRTVQTAGGNVTKYPMLIKHLQRAAFTHNSHQFKQWFKCEQIMAFCPTFLEWYANQHLEEPMRTSLLVRHKLIEGEQTVQNPLFSNDNFTFTEQIIGKQKDKKFWKLDLFDIKQKDVVFVDNDSSDSFNQMQKVLFNSNIVGFDSEFRATSHKYELDGVSIIQLSASKKVFIIDFITLNSSEKTINLLKKLFNSKEILKVGHSLKCDFLYLNKTFNLQTSSLNSFIDVMDLFKIKYPNQIQSSLSHIVLALTGIQLSKYQQRSNWNKRPLRRAQLHYAAIDAYICEKVYQKLNENVELNSLQLQKSQKTQGMLIISEGWLSYGPEYQYFLKKPKFIVDNMLKKLSTYLRNLGLDAEYLSVRDFEVAISIASIQQRIVLTKDKHLKFKKNMRVPCYLIQSQQSETMTKQVVAAFKIKLQQYTLLSRCVKCNNSDLVLVDTQTALAKLNFKHPDSAIKQFWCCTKCEQFYWQGHSYNNSRKRFSTFI